HHTRAIIDPSQRATQTPVITDIHLHAHTHTNIHIRTQIYTHTHYNPLCSSCQGWWKGHLRQVVPVVKERATRAGRARRENREHLTCGGSRCVNAFSRTCGMGAHTH